MGYWGMRLICAGLAAIGVATSLYGLAAAIGGPVGPILVALAGYGASYLSGWLCLLM